jgi:GNAT superfamily N-acetyltransferase
MLEIVPFEEGMLAGASDLLAASHARARLLEPLLPPAYEDAGAAGEAATELWRREGASGVAGVRDGKLMAFLIGVPRTPEIPALSMRYHGRAVAVGEDPELYKELYASLAGDWVDRGHFYHLVDVLPVDEAEQRVWDELGMGIDTVLTVRDVNQSVEGAGSVSIRQATEADAETALALSDALGRHHATSPVFSPFLPADHAPALESTQAELRDPSSACFFAYKGARVVGKYALSARQFGSPLLMPDSTIYLAQAIVLEEARNLGAGRALLAHTMRWAHERGYRWCSLHFVSANLSAARFWTTNGFRPLAHVRSRTLDPRIVWAR